MLIEEYFIEIEHDIISCPFIHSHNLIKDKRSVYIGLIEGVVKFMDNSTLHFMEFVDVGKKIEKYKYSYHYEDNSKLLIFRYDIAPHYRNIIKDEMRHSELELNELATALLNNLSSNIEYPVLIRDHEAIASLVKGALVQKDVVFCRIEDKDGSLLYQEGSKEEEPVREFVSAISTKKVVEETEEDLLLGIVKEEKDEIGKIYMADTLIVVNPDSMIKTVNQATLNLLGYKEDELIGKPVATIFEEEEEELRFKGTGIQDLIKKGTITNVEKTYLTKDGKKIPVLFSGSVMFTPLDSEPRKRPEVLRGEHLTGRAPSPSPLPSGERIKVRGVDDDILGIVCVALDITEQKRNEEELKKKTDRLERFNKMVVGREIEMVKLKEEVNILLEKSGEPKKYEVVEEIRKRGKTWREGCSAIISISLSQTDTFNKPKANRYSLVSRTRRKFLLPQLLSYLAHFLNGFFFAHTFKWRAGLRNNLSYLSQMLFGFFDLRFCHDFTSISGYHTFQRVSTLLEIY